MIICHKQGPFYYKLFRHNTNPMKIAFCSHLIQNLPNASVFAHYMLAVLSWHVQAIAAISGSEMDAPWHDISIEFEFWWKGHYQNGPSVLLVSTVCGRSGPVDKYKHLNEKLVRLRYKGTVPFFTRFEQYFSTQSKRGPHLDAIWF